MQRQGKYPPPPGAPDIPGLELAGEVVALGDCVARWKAGDKIHGHWFPAAPMRNTPSCTKPTRCR